MATDQVTIYDLAGKRHRLSLNKNEEVSLYWEKIIEELRALALLHQTPPAELIRRVNVMPWRVCRKLIEFGLLSGSYFGVEKTLKEHLLEWRDSQEANGVGDSIAEQEYRRVRLVFEETKADSYVTIDPSRIQRWLKRQQRDDERGFAKSTSNQYLRSVKQFCSWMVRIKGALRSPVEGLKHEEIRTRGTKKGRLTQRQHHRLCEQVKGFAGCRGMTGTSRSLLYQLAAFTGLRNGELRKLRCSQVVETLERVCLVVEDGFAGDTEPCPIPLPPSTALELRRFVTGREADALLFESMPDRGRMAAMLREDIEGAGIPTSDSSGKLINFDSLRKLYGRLRATREVPGPIAQNKTRKGDVSLLSNSYDQLSAKVKRRLAKEIANGLPDV